MFPWVWESRRPLWTYSDTRPALMATSSSLTTMARDRSLSPSSPLSKIVSVPSGLRRASCW